MYAPICIVLWWGQVTKRVESSHQKWRDWNWRSEGDIMVNGAYFITSGESLELKYEKAYSVEPKSAVIIDQLTVNAGVLGHRSPHLSPSLYFTILFIQPFSFYSLFTFTYNILLLLLCSTYLIGVLYMSSVSYIILYYWARKRKSNQTYPVNVRNK